MVVVRIAIALVDGDIQLVRTLDQIEALDRECGFRLSGQPLRIHLFKKRIGSIAAHAVDIEQADPEGEVVGRMIGPDPQADRQRLAGMKNERGFTLPVEQRDFCDFHLPGPPTPFGRLKQVRRRDGGVHGRFRCHGAIPTARRLVRCALRDRRRRHAGFLTASASTARAVVVASSCSSPSSTFAR